MEADEGRWPENHREEAGREDQQKGTPRRPRPKHPAEHRLVRQPDQLAKSGMHGLETGSDHDREGANSVARKKTSSSDATDASPCKPAYFDRASSSEP